MRASQEVALAAVQQTVSALQFLSKELQRDREVVLTAVGQEGSALKFASRELQSEIETRSSELAKVLGLATEMGNGLVGNEAIQSSQATCKASCACCLPCDVA